MKLVILDSQYLDLSDLREFGEVIEYPRTDHTHEAIVKRIEDADAVFTNKCPITREVMEACPKLRYIGELATGYNNIDIAAAREKGIPVCNIPSYSTDSVGQLTFALLLEICERVGLHDREVHEGVWTNCPYPMYKNPDRPLIELAGKTMGIIGFGKIGQATAKIAAAMGMKVLAYSRTVHEEAKALGTYVTLEELLAQSDVISLHCPLFPETKGIINRETIEKMKDGVIILNTARGPMVDEQALADALRSGKVYAAGVDVVSEEPIKSDNPLLSAPNCVITSHIAWMTREAIDRLDKIAVGNVRAFLNGSPINNVAA